jgi:hypothetical protein
MFKLTRRKIGGSVLGLAMLGLTLQAAPAEAASAAPGSVAAVAAVPASPATADTVSIYESFLCGGLTTINGIAWRYCHGVWFSGPPTRDLTLNVDASTNGGNFRSTFVNDVSVSYDVKHTLYWHCRYSDGSVSGVVGTSIVGGSAATSYQWGGGGYDPCNGYGVGLMASVYTDYGFASYHSVLDWNSNTAGPSFGYQRGHPEEHA